MVILSFFIFSLTFLSPLLSLLQSSFSLLLSCPRTLSLFFYSCSLSICFSDNFLTITLLLSAFLLPLRFIQLHRSRSLFSHSRSSLLLLNCLFFFTSLLLSSHSHDLFNHFLRANLTLFVSIPFSELLT